MPREDQLEIISPTGQIEFYSLDPEKGTTNIGRHPDNDIVVDGPGVAAFHALLDHQQKPYRIMLLEDAEARLSGKPLAPQVFCEIADWDTLELDGYSLVLIEGQGDTEPQAGRPAPVPASSGRPIGRLLQAVPAELKGRSPDQVDDLILTELSSREWTVDVEQTASCQLTIVNGGQLVANFGVRVEGLDEGWVSLSASQVNLYEGGRTTVTISVTPPRLPSSSAGPHHLVVVVTSANYPGRRSNLGQCPVSHQHRPPERDRAGPALPHKGHQSSVPRARDHLYLAPEPIHRRRQPGAGPRGPRALGGRC